jgi:hypothetical protein
MVFEGVEMAQTEIRRSNPIHRMDWRWQSEARYLFGLMK